MAHIDTSEEVRIPALGGPGHWSLRYHRAADELCLYDHHGLLLAGMPVGSEAVGRLRDAATGLGGPIGVRLPSSSLDLDWSLLFLPGSGDLVLRSPLGAAVGGTDRGRDVIEALAAALGAPR